MGACLEHWFSGFDSLDTRTLGYGGPRHRPMTPSLSKDGFWRIYRCWPLACNRWALVLNTDFSAWTFSCWSSIQKWLFEFTFDVFKFGVLLLFWSNSCNSCPKTEISKGAAAVPQKPTFWEPNAIYQQVPEAHLIQKIHIKNLKTKTGWGHAS